jgi:hypothetical protein
LSNSYLRFETTITPTQTSYDIPILSNDGTAALTEQRLNLQDSFFVSDMLYGLICPALGSYTGLQDTIFTFPSMALVNGVNVDRLMLFWNSFMKLTVNNTVICPQWDLRRHLFVPDGQRPSVPTGTTFPFILSDKNDGSQDGFYPVEPNWVLIGSRNNQMTINYPRLFDTSIVFAGVTIKIVVMVRGVLAQNTTPVR